MPFIYTRANLKDRINAGIQGRIGTLISEQDTMNEAVREVNSEIDFRSARRKAALSPRLFNEVFDYAAPSDLSALKIIDIPPQVKRADEFFLIPSEEFDRLKDRADGAIAIRDFNGTRRLLITVNIDDKIKVVATMDSLNSGGGTWVTFGGATNIRKDADNFVVDSGSLKWDIDGTAVTTAGIQNTGLTSFDLDDEYLGGNGAAFVWAYINSVTNLTNFILRLGSNTLNYHSKTITTQHDATAFVAGWNLLRFDLTSLVDTGSPDDDAITYAAIYMTKTTGKINETDYRFDHLVLRKGEIHEVEYYTKFGWQTSAAAYIENSTVDSDLLVADTDEFKIIVLKGISIAAREINDFAVAKDADDQYYGVPGTNKLGAMKTYQFRSPSDAKILTQEYYRY